MTTKITFGADPEFFVAKKENPGKAIPACGLFGGSKKSPVFLTPEGGYLEDGTTVEFNVQPKDTLPEVRTALDRLITAFLVQNKDYTIFPYATAEFTKEEIRKHPEASVIGCDADYWAYGIRAKPQINMFKGRRFAGGHIHIGLDPWPRDLKTEDFVKALDVYLWWPAAMRAGAVDPFRFQFYGHPGLYRETSYGVEYRTPDNVWCAPASALATGPLSYWAAVVAKWDQTVRKIVKVIEGRGAERFTSFLNNQMDYWGFETYMRNKSINKMLGISTKIADVNRRFEMFAEGAL